MSESLFCLSYFTAKDGCLDDLILALKSLINPAHLEEGCLLYELAQDKSNPNFLIVIEKFTNAEALAFHEEQSYVKDFVENAMNKLCEKVSWHEAVVIEDKVLG